MRRRTLILWAGGVGWAWSWWTMYREIFRWHHVTTGLRFNPPPPMPGTNLQPSPGLPLILVYVCCVAAPALVLATLFRAYREKRRPA